MGRKGLPGTWGESQVFSIRLTPGDRARLYELQEAWPETEGWGAVIRRAVQEAADREAGSRKLKRKKT